MDNKDYIISNNENNCDNKIMMFGEICYFSKWLSGRKRKQERERERERSEEEEERAQSLCCVLLCVVCVCWNARVSCARCTHELAGCYVSAPRLWQTPICSRRGGRSWPGRAGGAIAAKSSLVEFQFPATLNLI